MRIADQAFSLLGGVDWGLTLILDGLLQQKSEPLDTHADITR